MEEDKILAWFTGIGFGVGSFKAATRPPSRWQNNGIVRKNPAWPSMLEYNNGLGLERLGSCRVLRMNSTHIS